MSYIFNSRFGEQLYQLLPEIYRTRDKKTGPPGVSSGDLSLARYLDAHGHLLDLIHATLEQKLRDVLPESSQEWLLPYFAQLMAANIVSPDSDGRHAEIANAVSWRQRKGTLKCAEEIAEAVGQMEVEIQEGWRRVALTPRIGMPIVPADAWDNTLDIDMSVPSEAAQHPAMPAAMVDLRRLSQAVAALSTNPAVRVSNFGGIRQTWRQANLHGVPCSCSSFDDVSRRTADIRTPDAANGRYHHKRLLVYAPPPAGLFPFDPVRLEWSKRKDFMFGQLIEENDENGVWVIRNTTDRIIEITDKVTLSPARPYRVEGLNFRTKLSVDDGGRLELHQVEAVEVQVNTFSTDEPVMTAENCLFNRLFVGAGIAKIDSCTILDKAILKDVDAKNCIFNDFEYNEDVLIAGQVQYSRIPSSLYDHIQDKEEIKNCTTVDIRMFATRISYTADRRDNNGAGVLRPDCDPSIYAGASDGREIGYFHNGREERPVRITTDFTDTDALSLPTVGGYPLKDIVFESSVEVNSGTLELVRSTAKSLTVKTTLTFDADDEAIPALVAKDCLFDIVTVASGLARLEYCTIMQAASCMYLQASDCIFTGNITGGAGNKPECGCIRYSRIPEGFDGSALNISTGHSGTNTQQRPVFIKFEYCNNGTSEKRTPVFGEPGYGVLNPVTPDAIRFGAEDGGEMGSFHHKNYSLKAAAVLDKMREFLPVGIEPVLILDVRLLHVPPERPTSKKAPGNGGSS